MSEKGFGGSDVRRTFGGEDSGREGGDDGGRLDEWGASELKDEVVPIIERYRPDCVLRIDHQRRSVLP